MIFLSASRLNLFRDCPRCYWLLMKKNIKRPICMPTITERIDALVKKNYNEYRIQNCLPPHLDGKIKGRLAVNMPQTLRTEIETGVTIISRPDDYIEEEPYILPLDNKSSGRSPTTVHPANLLQMSVYCFTLAETGYKATNRAILVYYHPTDDLSLDSTVIEVKTSSHHQIEQLIIQAVEVLGEPIPKPGENCRFCLWTEQIQNHNQERFDVRQ